MNTVSSVRPSHSLLPDLADLVAALPTLPALKGLHRDSHPIRVEDEMTDSSYVLRAEMPGVDPTKDVDVVTRDGVLTVSATRTQQENAGTRSEFVYGSFTRSVRLPSNARADGIEASYESGVLTVTVPLDPSDDTGRHIDVAVR